MGWSISLILANERDEGYLGTFPQHQPASAREIIRKLSLPATNTSMLSDLDAGFSPNVGWFCIGAYNGAALISGAAGLVGEVENPKSEFIAKFIRLFPQASIIALELSSANNYFAYALYTQSNLQRMCVGDADRGVVVDIGVLQPEENSVLRGGTILPKQGEALAFAISQRFLGCPLDQFKAEMLKVELVKSTGRIPLFLRSLFSRRSEK